MGGHVLDQHVVTSVITKEVLGVLQKLIVLENTFRDNGGTVQLSAQVGTNYAKIFQCIMSVYYIIMILQS